MSNSEKTVLTAVSLVLIVIALLAAVLPVTTYGMHCGSVLAAVDPSTGARDAAACVDARRTRWLVVLLPMLVGAGLGLIRMSLPSRT